MAMEADGEFLRLERSMELNQENGVSMLNMGVQQLT